MPVRGRRGRSKACSHLLAAVVRPLHPVACLQKVEEPLGRNPRVGVAPQGHNLPQQDTKGPPTGSKTTSEWLRHACPALWGAQTSVPPAAAGPPAQSPLCHLQRAGLSLGPTAPMDAGWSGDSLPRPCCCEASQLRPHTHGGTGRPRQWVTEASEMAQSRPASAAKCRLDPGYGPRFPAHFLHLLCVLGILLSLRKKKSTALRKHLTARENLL